VSHCESLVMVNNRGGLATDRDQSALKAKVFDISLSGYRGRKKI